MKNTKPSSTANTQKAAALPAAMGRERNRRSGTMGSATRSSHITKATTSTSPATSVATISGLAQQAAGPDQRPDDAEDTAGGQEQADWIEAGASSFGPIGLDLGQDQRDHDQADGDVQPEDPGPGQAAVTAPPTTGPASTAIPVTLLNMPSAQARRCGGNTAESRASANGTSGAAPAPWMARAATRGRRPAPGRKRPKPS